MGNARSVTAVSVATAACLAAALAGCGRPVKTGNGGAAGPPAVGQAHTLTQAQIDAAIPPMPEFTGEDKAWADKLRGIYAGLSESKRQEMLTKDVCWFKLSDLPPEQAEVVKEFAKGQLGDQVDPAALTYGFGHALPSDPDHVRFFMERKDGGRAQPEIGLWPSGKAR